MDNAELIEAVRDLRDRVDELEQQQSDNEPQSWSPTRRRVLGALTGGGIGLLALLSASSPAAAAPDQLGEPSRRVDMYLGFANATSFTLEGSPIATAVVASGQVSLSSGSATVSTGVTATDATFYPAIGVDDPGADVAGLAAQLDFDTSEGEYYLTIKETGTSQNPTVNYDIVRAR